MAYDHDARFEKALEKEKLRIVFAALVLTALLLINVTPKAAFAEGGLIAQDVDLVGQADSEQPNVATPSQSEIRAYLAQNGASLDYVQTFEVTPVPNAEMGNLSAESKQSALAVLNSIRYIAGLEAVSLNENQGHLAQAAAFVDYVIGKLTHYPNNPQYGGVSEKPQGMSDEDWADGITGASRTNIAFNQRTLNAAVRDWMSDDDSNNIARVGHRRWCLNPQMGTTGFGAAGRYYAMHSFDNSNSTASQTNVVWPAQNMPVEYFANTDPWTISVGTAIADRASVRVELTRLNDNETWTFDTMSEKPPSSTSGEYFGVTDDSGGYSGKPGCIIFRPADISYNAGDRFHVKASGVNGATIEYDVEFFQGFLVESASFQEEVYYLKNSTLRLALKALPSDASSYQVLWASSDESVATVDDTGVVTKVGSSGSTTITATIPGEYTVSGEAVSASTVVVVPQKIDWTNFDITFGNNEYTGNPIQPTATIVEKATGKVLVEGEDYTIRLEAEITEPGEWTYAYIWGKGAYDTGSATGYYLAVEKRTITPDMIELSADTLYYNGAEQHPQVSVSFEGADLVEGSDYALSYSGGTAVGDYAVTIQGAGGHFRGSCTKAFSIVGIQLEDEMLSMDATSLVFTGATQRPAVSLNKGGTALVEGTDYVVDVDRSPVDAGSYTLTIRGKGAYSGELTRSFDITPMGVTDGNAAVTWSSLTYNKQQQEAVPNVRVAGKSLVMEEDYTIEYDNANNGLYGEQGATLRFKGNYTGVLAQSYEIAKLGISEDDVSLGANELSYTGGTQTVELSVAHGNVDLEEDVDYELVWADNKNAGDASVTVRGIGGCEGTLSKTFKINPVELTATYDGEEISYNGQPSLPVRVTGFVAGENAQTAAGYVSPTIEIPQSLSPGIELELTPEGGSADNYVFKYVSGLLKVGEKPAWVNVMEAIEAIGELADSATEAEQDAFMQRVNEARAAYEALGTQTGDLPSSSIEALVQAGEQQCAILIGRTHAKLEEASAAQMVADAAKSIAETARETAEQSAAVAKNTDGKTVEQQLAEAQAAAGDAAIAKEAADNYQAKALLAKQAADKALEAAELLESHGQYASDEQKASISEAKASAGEQLFAAESAVSEAAETVSLAEAVQNEANDQVNTAQAAVNAARAAEIAATDKTVAMGKTIKLGATVNSGGALTYSSSDTKVAKVSSTGVVTPVKVGKVTIRITAAATDNYDVATRTVVVTVTKGANPMVFRAQTKTVKYAKLKKAKQVVSIKASKAQGAVIYKKVKVNKKKANFSVGKTTGKITVKKGTPKGTYKVTVQAYAKGNANYKPSTKWVKKVITIKVK